MTCMHELVSHVRGHTTCLTRGLVAVVELNDLHHLLRLSGVTGERLEAKQ